jgi:hypothetical protein
MAIQQKTKDRYPLLNEGYPALECAMCDKKCYPDAKTADGSVIYNRHFCKVKSGIYRETVERRFEITENGDFVI